MTASIKKSIMLIALVATFISCNQSSTLQSYYVDNELKPGFTSLDVPLSVLNIEESTMTDEEKEAYESIDKLNMLAFVIDQSNEVNYKVELTKIQDILKDAKYDELMRGGNTEDGKFVVKFLGEEDQIDELILFGNANNKGFVVIRVLGKKMNVNKILKLASVLEKVDINDTQISQFANFFK